MAVLRALINGVWVDVGGGSGGPEEVFVGPADPGVGAGYDLWYDSDAVNPAQTIMQIFPNRNLLDNGQHMINQRLIGGNVAVGAANTFLADRWACWNSGVGTVYLYHSTAAAFGVFPPAGRPRPGYVQSLQMSVGEAAGSLAPADWMYYKQAIEGQNLQHLNWGSADAKPLTLSFDVYSPIATTFVIELERFETTARSISKLCPVPAGFSTQVFTFPGDIVTPITNDTTGRLALNFWIAAGSNWTSGILNTSWNNRVDANRVGGISNAWQNMVGAPLAFTNIQLEVGSIATPYEVRRFDDELAHCMRYYEKSYPYGTIPGSNAGYAGSASCALFDSAVPTRMRMTSVDFRVTKRTTPTYQAGWAIDGTIGYINAYNAPANKFQIATYGTISDRQWACDYMTLVTNAAVSQYYHFHWAAGAEI